MDIVGDGDPIAVLLRFADGGLRERIRLGLLDQSAVELVVDPGEADVVVTDDIESDERSVVLIRDGQLPLRVGWGGSMLGARAGTTALRIAIEATHHGLICRPENAPVGGVLAGASAIEDADNEDEGEPVLLSGREAEVLQLMSTGASNKAMARALGISAHTVKFHVAGIMTKLGAASRTDAVARGMRAGLVML